MLVNMAVWHTTDREDNRYLCLQVGGLELHRCRSAPAFYFLDNCLLELIPSPKAACRPICVEHGEVCVH